ncbi:hypothetical protein [Delftia sp. WSY_7]|uniref:hypothetical protein n=1 Tax=Delftia sp. WSY_7 TaxID=3367202 RepID=UPI00370CEF8F
MKPVLTPINHGAGFGMNRRAIDSAQEPVPSAKALRQRRMRDRPIRASTTQGTFHAPELLPSGRPGAMDAFKLPSLISGKRVYPKGQP